MYPVQQRSDYPSLNLRAASPLAGRPTAQRASSTPCPAGLDTRLPCRLRDSLNAATWARLCHDCQCQNQIGKFLPIRLNPSKSDFFADNKALTPMKLKLIILETPTSRQNRSPTQAYTDNPLACCPHSSFPQIEIQKSKIENVHGFVTGLYTTLSRPECTKTLDSIGLSRRHDLEHPSPGGASASPRLPDSKAG